MLTLWGGGFGHGIGMAQWGAEGQAREGATAEEIVAHYYPGATVEARPTERVRVLLGESGGIRLSLPEGSRLRLGDDPFRAAPRSVSASLSADGARIVVRNGAGRVVGSATKVRLRAPDGKLLRFADVPYRGDLVLRRHDGLIALVNDIAIDDYVRGVVSREVYASWKPATLEAQAITARSYALASRRPGDVFDVYPDTRSQVYGGGAAETAPTDAAVARTAGEVATYDGEVVQTFFYDTSPGATASISDVWGGPGYPFLVSVPDPWSKISPYYRWRSVRWSPVGLGQALGVGRVDDVELDLGAGGWTRWLRVRPSGGAFTQLSGAQVRSLLGLRSGWFRLQLLDLRRATRSGRKLALVGRTSPGGRLRVLLHRTGTGRWEARRLGDVAPGRLDLVLRDVPADVDAVQLALGQGRSLVVGTGAAGQRLPAEPPRPGGPSPFARDPGTSAPLPLR